MPTRKPRTLFDVQLAYVDSPAWRRLAPRSKSIYINGMDSLIEFKDKNLDDIRRPDIIDLKDRLYDRPGKCRVAMSVLNNLFKFAYDKGWVDQNPAFRVTGLPKVKHIPRWTERELDIIIATAPKYLADVMVLALYTGQRASDLVKMKWDDIEGNHIKVHQRKTGKDIYIPIHPRLRSMLDKIDRVTLKRNGRKSPFIIHSFRGDPWNAPSLCASMHRFARTQNIYKSLHGIRKSTASILRESGCSIEQIMSILGHDTFKQSEEYSKEASQKILADEAMKKWK